MTTRSRNRTTPWRGLALGLALAFGPPRARATDELILCGGDEVFALKVDSADGTADPAAKVWSWRAKDCPDIPERLRNRFGTTDECKPVDGGTKILITSSGGGVALVDRATGRARFAAFVGNAHSAELLPGDRIVVAGSTHPEGNRLAVFDIARPDAPVYAAPLYSAHGVVWDAKRQVLWALGSDQLNGYRLANWDGNYPSLHLTSSYPLPDPGGHDLQPARDSGILVLTSSSFVSLFHLDRRAFFTHPTLGARAGVKCVSIHPKTGWAAIVQADPPHWWSDTVRWLIPGNEIRLPGQRIYKARWRVAE